MYWATSMITHDWVQNEKGRHALYRASVTTTARDGSIPIVAYPLKRPDGRWSILLINRDPTRAQGVRLVVKDRANAPPKPAPGPYAIVQYGSQDYVWRAAASDGSPSRNEPPRRFTASQGPVTLPPYSITVVQSAPPRR